MSNDGSSRANVCSDAGRAEALNADARRVVSQLDQQVGGGFDKRRRATEVDGRLRVWWSGNLAQHSGIDTARIAAPIERLGACQCIEEFEMFIVCGEGVELFAEDQVLSRARRIE